MSRNKGTFDFPNNFEVRTRSPLDAKQRVGTLSDLTSPTQWQSNTGDEWTFPGMIVSVYNDGTNNGVYRLNTSDYTLIANWSKLGDNSDIASLSTVLSTETSSRISGDGSLSTAVSTTNSTNVVQSTAISTEISTRGSADTSLSTAISTTNSTNVVQSTAISTEISSRGSADTSLTSAVSSTNSNISSNYVPITRTVNTKALNTNISLNYSDVGACSNTDGRLTDARPASDVYSWAKSSVKPSYATTELTDQSSVLGNRTYSYQNIITNGQTFTASLDNLDLASEKLHQSNSYVGGTSFVPNTHYFSTSPGFSPVGYTHIINNEIFINMQFRFGGSYGNTSAWYLIIEHQYFVPYTSGQEILIMANAANTTPSTRAVRIDQVAGGPTGYMGQIWIWYPTPTCYWNLHINYTLDPLYWGSL